MRFLSAFFSVILVVFLLGSQFSASLIKMHYWWNYDFIVTELCVNRDKPMLQCNGKCFLGQKLKQAKDNQKKAHPASSLDELPVFSVWFLPVSIAIPTAQALTQTRTNIPVLKELQGFPILPIRPPIVS